MLKQLNRDELKSLLKNLRIFYGLQKDMWKRSIQIFKNKLNKTHSYVIEYYDSLSHDIALKEAMIIFDKVFWAKPNKDEIKLIRNDNIAWWIRVIMDDKMVDLSYAKLKEKIQS